MHRQVKYFLPYSTRGAFLHLLLQLRLLRNSSDLRPQVTVADDQILEFDHSHSKYFQSLCPIHTLSHLHLNAHRNISYAVSQYLEGKMLSLPWSSRVAA